jgi:hypothetical protein
MLGYAAKDSKVLLPLIASLEQKIAEAELERVVEIEHRRYPP